MKLINAGCTSWHCACCLYFGGWLTALQHCGLSAGLTSYTHCVGTHQVHSVLSCCISAKCGPSGHPACIHTLCSISIIYLQIWGPLAGPTACTHYVRIQEVHSVLICCISPKCGPSCHSLAYVNHDTCLLYLFQAVAHQLVRQHTYTM